MGNKKRAKKEHRRNVRAQRNKQKNDKENSITKSNANPK